MGTELVKSSPISVPAVNGAPTLPELVERAGVPPGSPGMSSSMPSITIRTRRGRISQQCGGSWPGPTEKGWSWRASRRAWSVSTCYGLGGSASKRNLHLSALRGFFDRLVQRHVVVLNPAASVSGVKETVVEGKTPEITLEQARKLIASVKTTYTVKTKGQKPQEVVSVVGLRDRAILSTLAYTACRAGAVAKLRLQDFQHDGEQYVLRFQEKGGKSREIPVRLELQRDILAYLAAAGIGEDNKDQPLFRSTVAGRSN